MLVTSLLTGRELGRDFIPKDDICGKGDAAEVAGKGEPTVE